MRQQVPVGRPSQAEVDDLRHGPIRRLNQVIPEAELIVCKLDPTKETSPLPGAKFASESQSPPTSRTEGGIVTATVV